MRGFAILDNNTFYKTTVIKIMWHEHREIMIKIQSQEMDSRIYGHSFYLKGVIVEL